MPKPTTNRHAVLKVQSVRNYDVELTPPGAYSPDAKSTGQQIDEILDDYHRRNEHVSKIALDLNPPKEPHPADME